MPRARSRCRAARRAPRHLSLPSPRRRGPRAAPPAPRAPAHLLRRRPFAQLVQHDLQVAFKVDLPRVGRVDLGEKSLDLELGGLGAEGAEEDDLRGARVTGAGTARTGGRAADSSHARAIAAARRFGAAGGGGGRGGGGGWCAHEVLGADGAEVVLVEQIEGVADLGHLALLQLALLPVVPARIVLHHDGGDATLHPQPG